MDHVLQALTTQCPVVLKHSAGSGRYLAACREKFHCLLLWDPRRQRTRQDKRGGYRKFVSGRRSDLSWQPGRVQL